MSRVDGTQSTAAYDARYTGGAVIEDDAVATANLVRWLRRQLRQATPDREHIEAAVANEDPQELRRLLFRSPFSDAQRRYLEDLIQRWERAVRGAS